MTEAKPLPLSAEEIEEIREYHLGPAIPGTCADGQQITSEPCPKCHAKSNQTCGRWVTKTEKHVVALLGHITSLQAENALLRQNQRTPYAVEVCSSCGALPNRWHDCAGKVMANCPMRSQEKK